MMRAPATPLAKRRAPRNEIFRAPKNIGARRTEIMITTTRAKYGKRKIPALQGRFGSIEIKVVSVRDEPISRAATRNMDEPALVARFWKNVVRRSSWHDPEKENLIVLCLNTRFGLKSFALVSVGTVNEALAAPREVFRPAIADSAYAILVAHNHPSGDASPSRADQQLTSRLFKAGELLQIGLIDHVIIGSRSRYSFRQDGEWPPRADWQGRGENEKDSLPPAASLDTLAAAPLAPGRIERMSLTAGQWGELIKARRLPESFVNFLVVASSAQLQRIREHDLCPIGFEAANGSDIKRPRFVMAKGLRPSETRDWWHAQNYRYLIREQLRQRKRNL
jgi:DNA repair protein RadC